MYIHTFASIPRKWKIFHQSILLPRSEKTLNDFQ